MTAEEQVVLLKQMSEDARSAGYYHGLLQGLLMNIRPCVGSNWNIDQGVVEKVKRLIEQ